MANVTLAQVGQELEYLKHKVAFLEKEIEVILDVEPEVRPQYLKKLKSIESEKGRAFSSKDELMSFLRNGL